MLSAACHEPPTPPAPEAAESARSVVSFRRIAVSFASDSRQTPGARRGRREMTPVVSVPRYSRIVFHAGSASPR